MLSTLERKDLQEKGVRYRFVQNRTSKWLSGNCELSVQEERRQTFISPNTKKRKRLRLGAGFCFLVHLKLDDLFILIMEDIIWVH